MSQRWPVVFICSGNTIKLKSMWQLAFFEFNPYLQSHQGTVLLEACHSVAAVTACNNAWVRTLKRQAMVPALGAESGIRGKGAASVARERSSFPGFLSGLQPMGHLNYTSLHAC